VEAGYGFSGLHVIGDPHDPAAARVTGHEEWIGLATSLEVAGGHAYILQDVNGFRVVDVGDPSAPQTVATAPTADTALSLAVGGGHIYVGSLLGWIDTYDVTNPAAPAFRSRIDARSTVWDLALTGSHLLAGVRETDGGLLLFDLSDPGTPNPVAIPTFPFERRGVGRPRRGRRSPAGGRLLRAASRAVARDHPESRPRPLSAGPAASSHRASRTFFVSRNSPALMR
jgi:hypothetical protein